jgi:glucose-6-phosphate-specific signal transduction histidine kinase
LKNIEIRIAAHRQGELEELIKKEEEKKLTPADISRQIHQKIGGNIRSIATQYGEFRSGRRTLSTKLIQPLAEILEVSENFLQNLNESFRGRILLELDPKLKFKDFLDSIPQECETVDEFLIWFVTESQRRELMSRI